MNIHLRIARIKKELSQIELAKRVGITNKYLSQLETGTSNNPSSNVMRKIAYELDETVQNLFFND